MTEVRVELNEAELAKVLWDPGFGDALLRTAKATVVAAARDLAPRRTGEGADSIRGKLLTRDGYRVMVSWDKTHYYMQFQDLGTIYIAGKHFLERAAEEFEGVGAQGAVRTFRGRGGRIQERATVHTGRVRTPRINIASFARRGQKPAYVEGEGASMATHSMRYSSRRAQRSAGARYGGTRTTIQAQPTQAAHVHPGGEITIVSVPRLRQPWATPRRRRRTK